MITKITEAVSKKRLVKDNVYDLLAKIAGWMLTGYVIAKIIDTIYWATTTVPSMGFHFMQFYSNNALYGPWILITEVIICGALPALILINPKSRQNPKLLVIAVTLAAVGVSLNRWVMVLQVLAAPVLTFQEWVLYYPSWQEVATTILPVAYGVIMILISFRYMPIFPQEKELNPIEPPLSTAAVEETEEAPAEAAETAAEPELKPAEA